VKNFHTVFRAALLSLTLMGGAAMAEQILLLPDGQSVILKDDGTWAYVEEKISGALRLDFGKSKYQQGQCYAWPSLTNDTNKFVDGLAINYSTHSANGATLRTSTLNFNVIGIGKVVTQQEYLTKFAAATCNDVAYIQIDSIDKCKIAGKSKNIQICYDLLVVYAEVIQAIK
jgi:hypothetical protein